MAAVCLAGTWASCSRQSVLSDRIAAIDNETAREVLRDCLWRHGSHYTWVEHRALRWEVTRTEHRPLGDVVSGEVWVLDTVGDRVRIERPERRQVTLASDGRTRVFVDGRETQQAELLAEAAGDVRLVREIGPMPFSLLRPGLGITYLGTRVGPGEARSWHRLLVTYGAASGAAARDRLLVEVRRSTREAASATIRWSEFPLLGQRYRVVLDDWREEGGLRLARRWRLYPLATDEGPPGPLRYSVRVDRLALDTPTSPGTFARP